MGCPLRWEDGTRGPLCQQLLRHLLSFPAFGGLPPTASEQPCLSCSAGTGGLTPAWGSTAPASTCLVLAAQTLQSNTGLPVLTLWLGLGKATKGGQASQAFHTSLAGNAVPVLPGALCHLVPKLY